MPTPRKTIHDIRIPERAPRLVEDRKPAGVPKSKPRKKAAPAPSRVLQRSVRQQPRVRVIARQSSVPVRPRVTSTKKSGFGWWLLCIAALLILVAYGYGAWFAAATITINPQEVSGQQGSAALTLAREPQGQQVPLVVMKLDDTITETIRSTGSEQVSQRASGTIMIYNAFSTEPQRLVQETRFEAPDGRIYKTAAGSDTIIPGMQGATPGQISVTVYAAEPGDTYNADLTDFVIPGFRGGAKFEKIYARSVTPMTGGYVGARAVIAAEDSERVTTTLSQKLGDRLRAEAFLQKTDDFIILADSARTQIGELSIDANPDNPTQAKVTLAGSYSAVLINKTDLARALAVQLIPGYAGQPIAINNLDALAFAINPPYSGPLEAAERLNVAITGVPQFVYQVDEPALIKQLLGLSRKEAQAVMGRYAAIASARIRVLPFWKMGLPTQDEDIQIKYYLDGK